MAQGSQRTNIKVAPSTLKLLHRLHALRAVRHLPKQSHNQLLATLLSRAMRMEERLRGGK